MGDLVAVLATVVCFAVCAGLVRVCESVVGGREQDGRR